MRTSRAPGRQFESWSWLHARSSSSPAPCELSCRRDSCGQVRTSIGVGADACTWTPEEARISEQIGGGPTMKRILIATDGSEAAREAVELGVELAEDEGAEAIFVHVVPLSHMVSMNGFGLMGHVPYEPTDSDECL